MNRTRYQPEPYSDFRERRELAEGEANRNQDYLDRENARAREERLAELEANREAGRQKAEEALNAQLEPTRVRLEREWVAAQSGKTAADFRQHAWPLLRKNLVDDLGQQRVADAEAALRRGAGGVRYGL